MEDQIQQKTDLDLIINSPKAVEQIMSRIALWQDNLSSFFTEFQEYANMFRMIEMRQSTPTEFTRTRVGETIRATEALTTSIYRMMTSADPCYDVVSLNMNQTADQLFASHILLRKQDYMIKWRRRLLRATRNLCLFGTTIVETPWVMKYRFGQLAWESLGFVPRSLLQCAFDPNIFDIQDTPWLAFLDYMTEDQLLDKADEEPDFWNPQQIQKAIDTANNSSNWSKRIQERRRQAGYKEMPLYEVATYYGRLRDIPREDKRLWCVRVVNESVPISAFGNPSPTGEIPFHVARYLDFELEPYGRGVGSLGKLSQRAMDENRGRYMDIARMALFNMWIKGRTSGVRNSDLKIKPMGIIEADDINQFKAHVPDLNTVTLGLKIEEVMRAEHQGATGATPNLQAQVTDASATESSIAQNEAIRRVSVIAEDVADSLVRDFQMSKHAYNSAWFGGDLMVSIPGQSKPVRVNRATMAHEIDLFVKITTDKDFRPKRMEYLNQLYQVLTSIRNRPNIQVDDLPVLEEIIRGLDVSPDRVIRKPDNLAPQSIVNALASSAQQAKLAAQEFGDESKQSLDNSGIPGPIAAETPVGATLVTP